MSRHEPGFAHISGAIFSIVEDFSGASVTPPARRTGLS
jgi:hypothetical protein